MNKQSRCCASDGLQRIWTLNLVSWNKYILPILIEKNSTLVLLIDNVLSAWWFCVYFLNRHWRHEVHILWRPSLAQRLLYLLILQRLFGWQRLHYRRWRHHLSWMRQEKTHGRYSWAIKFGGKLEKLWLFFLASPTYFKFLHT